MTQYSLSKSIQDLPYSVIREMSSYASGMDNAINLSIGAPDLSTPEEITQQAFKDAMNGHTHYTNSKGDPELLDKLAKVSSERYGKNISADDFLVTHGAMNGLVASLRTLLEQGDEVILIEPHFPDYMAHIALAGGVAVKVASSAMDRFVPAIDDIEAVISNRTKAILLNSPNNPTGAILPPAFLDDLAELSLKHNITVISDEVYDEIVFDEPCESIYTRPGMDQNTIVIKSFSKSYAMTGWRLGYCFGPTKIMEQLLKVINYSTACASSISQRAALAALAMDRSVITEMGELFRKRVDLVYDRLSKMNGVSIAKPAGSFYLFPDLGEITAHTKDFAIELIKEKQVIVVPGYAFGKSCESSIRIACTRDLKQLDEAMDRLEHFLTLYKGN